LQKLVAGYQRFRKQVFFLDDGSINFLRNFGHYITGYISSLPRYMVQFGDGVSQYNNSNRTGFGFRRGEGTCFYFVLKVNTYTVLTFRTPTERVQSEANSPSPSSAAVNNNWSQTANYPVCSFYIHLVTSSRSYRGFKKRFPTLSVSSYCSYSVPLVLFFCVCVSLLPITLGVFLGSLLPDHFV